MLGEGVRMRMCVGREGGRGCENEDVCWERVGDGRGCENEDGCWERGWERV